MYDRIYFTDICKELVAKTLALAGTLYKSRNIYKFDGSRCYLLRMIKLTEFTILSSGTETIPTFGSIVANG